MGKPLPVQPARAGGAKSGVWLAHPCPTVARLFGARAGLAAVPSPPALLAPTATMRVGQPCCRPRDLLTDLPSAASPVGAPTMWCRDHSHQVQNSLVPAPCAPSPCAGQHGEKQTRIHGGPCEPWLSIGHPAPPASSLFSPGFGIQSSVWNKGQPCFQGHRTCGEEEEVSEHFSSPDPRGIHAMGTECKAPRHIQPGQVLILPSSDELCQQQHLHQPPAAIASSLSAVSSKAKTGAALFTRRAQEPIHVLHSSTRKSNPGASAFGGATCNWD